MELILIFLSIVIGLAIIDAIVSRIRASGNGGKALLVVLLLLILFVGLANQVVP